MHVVVDYTPAVHQGAGIGRHTRGLVQGLAAVLQEEKLAHSITLLVFGRPSGGVRVPAGCAVRVVPVSARALAIAWHRLHLPWPVTWLGVRGDLYHASDFVLPPTGGMPALVTVHDLSFLAVPQCADAGLRAYLNRVVPRSVRRAQHVLADSENTKRDLVRLLDVPADKITVVYPGVEPRFRPVEDAAALAAVRRKYGLGQGPFVLGVGTLEPRKNWPALIRAWAQLRRTTSLPHRLVIAGGKGWLYDAIFQTAEETGLAEAISFPGFVDDADLPALYSAADVFVYPSLYEGFGLPVLEALACGTPVVCADNSSLPEAAGDAALLVNAADEEALAAALYRLLTDDVLRQSLRQRGLAHAQRFTWQASARVLLAAYQRVYAETLPPPLRRAEAAGGEP
ncbi:MAG: glycosyltransferase family 1 protein [Anaerolineae bacterium]|nr:glycosyltransferase family 1 protein [Anaerolineae bacterium]